MSDQPSENNGVKSEYPPQNPQENSGLGSLVAIFAKHNNAANLLMILMLLFGFYALGRINTQFFPTIEADTISVSIAWSGASAEDIESNILEIVEPELRFLDGVDSVSSYAREGNGSIFLEFQPSTDMLTAKGDVDAAISSISNLPEDSDTPKISYRARFDPVARIAIAGDVPEQTLRFYAKKIRDDLIERGIDKVSFSGLRSPELSVKVPERELRRLGLTVSDISNAITQNSKDQPSGTLSGGVERQLRAASEADSARALGEIAIRSFNTGDSVKLKDVADIAEGFDPDEPLVFLGNKRAIELNVQRAPTADTLQTAGILFDYLAEIENSLPAGLEVVSYQVQADALSERIWLLIENGALGLLIVIGVLFLFLNAKVAFWVAAGIPVAMMATMGLLYLSGQSINMISLFGLIMTLGIIVDDAIVVGEHTATRAQMGDEPLAAAINGAGRMLTPVIAAMLTTIAAFAPIWLIGGTIGQIMGVLPFVVIAVILASLVECFLILPGHLYHSMKEKPSSDWSFLRQLTFGIIAALALLALIAPQMEFLQSASPFISALIIAMMGFVIGSFVELLLSRKARLLKKNKQEAGVSLNGDGAVRQRLDAGFDWFKNGPFQVLAKASYNFRYVTIAIAIGSVLVIAIGLVRGDRVGFVFFPSPEADNLRGRIVFYTGTPQDQQVKALFEISKSLKTTVEQITNGEEELVKAEIISLGTDGRRAGDNVASFFVQLTSSEARSIRTREIIQAWRRNLPQPPGVRRVSVRAPRAGPPGREIDIELFGDDLNQMKLAAEEILDLVQSLDGVSGAADTLPFGNPELVFELTHRGESLGFTIDEIGRQLRSNFEGQVPRRFARGDDEVSIRVIAERRSTGALNLQQFELRTPQGQFVPLLDVVAQKERQGFAAIERINGRTTVNVQASLDTEVQTTDQAQAQLLANGLNEVVAKWGLDYKFSGRAEERREAFADLFNGILVALAVIYIILAWVFANYWRPFAIMLIIPFGLVGAILGHYLMGQNLTILSLIGLLGLSGILVNDSIILVSRLDERLENGDSVAEAAIGASQDRLRAVLLTSFTTIGGLVPLLYEKSVQAQFLVPMAITIIFGLAIATLLVLFLVPALIGIGYDIAAVMRYFFGQVRKKASPAE